MEKDIRWKQRFENFTRAYQVFSRILIIKNPNEAEKMGLIQAFELVFELSWKTIKDYLKEEGYQESSPRAVLKQAFQNQIIKDGHNWIEALQNRNQTVHAYDDDMAKKIDEKIRQVYAPMIHELFLFLSKEKNCE